MRWWTMKAKQKKEDIMMAMDMMMMAQGLQKDRVHTSEQRSFKNKSTADLTDFDSEKRVGRSDKLLVTVSVVADRQGKEK